MRINKFIASCGFCSRRKADELIASGQVFWNGKKVTEAGLQVNEGDKITIAGKVLKPIEDKKYFAINKPAGVTSTLDDPHAEKKIIDLLPKDLRYLKTGGRLDRETEGLMILSNDGDFLNKLMHPSFELDKEYVVEVRGKLDKNAQNRLQKGIKLNGKLTSPARVFDIDDLGKKTKFHIIIHEGRKRQIRLMCEAVGHGVLHLKRIRIGNIELGDLARGKWRELNQNEVDFISKLDKC